ncbi:hypothetical protein D9615_009814 [Tricholomella constricta]|uniref:NADP-dependent oxidoreductase domain-containing protein n=1 Tax=Tricholomella constricta TaxID=117010 RepID=A0A8H5LVE2_9AGAR|nr:hypothetical protein D9615_009814 [Tricholomella constricta]
MPWDTIKLNDGHSIPSIAFGTWKLGNGQGPIDQVDQALSVGFSHVGSAQAYRNEAEAGIAIRESGLAREDIFITTKYSGLDGLDIPTSIRNSLKNLGVTYVDLYLIHHPRLAVPDIPTAWRQMEELKEMGLVKSIGVSNFEVAELEILLASAKIKPAANQILLHPYVYAKQKPIIEYAAMHRQQFASHRDLSPITVTPGGPLDTPLNKIAERLGATNDQVLLAWVKAKGAVVVTTSSKNYRLEGYLRAGDLELTDHEISALDKAGAKGATQLTAKTYVYRLLVLTLTGAMALGFCNYMGLDVL